MSVPSTFTLVNETITTAVTTQQFTTQTGFAGIQSLTLEAVFTGTGGSTAIALIRSRMDSGSSWREVARFDFSAAGSEWVTLTAAATSIAAFSALSADSVLNGFLGSEFQAVVTTTGTWTNGNMTVRGHAR